MTVVNKYTFSGCSGLKGSLKLGDGITSIGVYAFDGCSSLTGNVVLPEALKKIDVDAFEKCTGFTGYLRIGPNVTRIGGGAFSNVYGILNFSKIYCMAITPPMIDQRTFGYAVSGGSSSWPKHLLVPIGCKEKYESADYWRYFTIIEETEF